MGMQLRVESAARVLTEHPDHDPFGIDTHHMTPPPQPRMRLRLDPTQHRVYRPVMCLGHLRFALFVAYGEQNRHRLRRRKRRIEPPHRTVAEAATQPLPCRRMQSGHHRQERLIVDHAVETEHPRRRVRTSDPAAHRCRGSTTGAARCSRDQPRCLSTLSPAPSPCHPHPVTAGVHPSVLKDFEGSLQVGSWSHDQIPGAGVRSFDYHNPYTTLIAYKH